MHFPTENMSIKKKYPATMARNIDYKQAKMGQWEYATYNYEELLTFPEKLEPQYKIPKIPL
jgi:hypothetical protein